ncbi:MAG: hypothetical protein U1E56_09360 [Bauldia sp.]
MVTTVEPSAAADRPSTPAPWRGLLFAAAVAAAALSTPQARAEDDLVITITASRGVFAECARPDFTNCGPTTSRTANISGTVTYNTKGAHVVGRLLDLPETIDLTCQTEWTKTAVVLAGDRAIAECRYSADIDANKLRVELNYTLGARERSGVIRQVLTLSIDVQSCIVGLRDASVKPALNGTYVAQCIAKQ